MGQLLAALALVTLICTGHEVRINGKSRRVTPFADEIGIDLDTLRWCEEDCRSLTKVQTIEGTLLVLSYAPDPNGNVYKRETLDRSTGAFEDTEILLGVGMRRSGSCRPSP
jgi:hypothetical protein